MIVDRTPKTLRIQEQANTLAVDVSAMNIQVVRDTANKITAVGAYSSRDSTVTLIATHRVASLKH